MVFRLAAGSDLARKSQVWVGSVSAELKKYTKYIALCMQNEYWSYPMFLEAKTKENFEKT